MTRTYRLALFSLLILALLVRLAWSLHLPTDDHALRGLPDQWEYLSIGRNLLDKGELSFVDERFDDTVHAFRMPLYPTFVALCGGSVRVVRIAQCLLDTSTVIAIFLLTRRLLAQSDYRCLAALFAGALVAFNPFLIFFTGLILTETLFTAMLAWAMVLLAPTGSGPSPKGLYLTKLLPGGLLLALTILVRPSSLFLPVLLGLAGVFLNCSTPTSYYRRGILSAGLTMILLTLVVLLPWAWRNYHVTGEWIWTTTNSGFTSYDGFNPRAEGSSNQWFTKELPELRDMNETERSRYLGQLASDFIRDHPMQSISLIVPKIARTWSPIPLSAQYGGQTIYLLVGLLFTVPYDLLVLLGLWKGRLARSAKVFLLIPAIYFTAIHAISVGSLRYRVPVEPPMAPLAGIACVMLATGRHRSMPASDAHQA